MGIVAGKAAPAFTLTGADGKPASLKDFRGKHVIVYFYPKAADHPAAVLEALAAED